MLLSVLPTGAKRLTAAVVAAVVLVVVSGAVAVVSRHSGPVQIAFLGDSYTYGYGATRHSDGYAYDVARAEHWSTAVVGIPGAGYARIAPRYEETIAGGIDAVVAARPRILVVECGHNDAEYHSGVAVTERRALHDLRVLAARLPHTRIVVLGPVWLDGTPSASALAVRDAIRAAQRRVPGTVWIDPIAQRWFTGEMTAHTGDDATMINDRLGHPNDAGYAHMARRLEADLRTLRIGH